MDMVALTAQARDATAKARQLRRAGQVPGVVYGNTIHMPIQCPEIELHQAFARAGESTLVELSVGEKKIPVLFKHVDLDPVSDREIHVDFYAVDMKAEIETTVPVHFEGEAPAVKTLGGIFVVSHDHVQVRCLPADLPHAITINVAGMEAFRATVSVKDLQVPKGVKVQDGPETVIASIQEPREEEVVQVALPTEGAAPVEGAPAAEGAAPADGAAAAPTAEAQTKEKAAKEGKGKK